jgi:hypothetical protein
VRSSSIELSVLDRLGLGREGGFGEEGAREANGTPSPFSFEGICAKGENQTRGGVSTTCNKTYLMMHVPTK